MKRKYVTTKAGDALELTKEVMRQMRPMREADPAFITQWEKEGKRRGRPKGRTKAVVSLSLDQDIIALLRAGGSGWQSRVNTLLRAAVGLNDHQ